MKKLALVISSLGTGGAERVISTLANAWATQNVEVHIITFESPGTMPSYPLDDTIHIHQLAQANQSPSIIQAIKNNFLRITALRTRMTHIAPDAVISFMDQTNVLTVLASQKRWPTIISERISPANHPIGKLWSLLRRFVYPKSTALVVQTTGTAKWFSWMPDAPSIIPNPVLTSASPNTQKVREKTVLAAGRLTHQKGFDLLIKAFAETTKDQPGWNLRIHGEGEMRQNLEQLIQQLDMKQQISLPGTTRDLARQMADCAIFALPSRYEGFPNVLCEAMAEGAAVVATDCQDGPSDIIVSKKNGLLVESGNIQELTKGLKILMHDSHMRTRLGAEAQKVSDRFSLQAVLHLWNQLIRKVSV